MKVQRVGISLGLAFAMVLALSQVAIAAPAATYDISFDGYCDGMQLNIPSQGLGSADTVDGMHTGCVTGGLIGTKSSAPNAAHLTSFSDFQGYPLHTQVNANHTWTIYGRNGNLIYFINSGTWSFGLAQGSGTPAALG